MMTSDLRIAPVNFSELQTLCDVGAETFSETFTDQNDPVHFKAYISKTFTLDRVTKEFQTPGSHFFFAKLDSEVAGYLKLNVGKAQTEQELPNALEIERIYAKQSYHGKGIGKALMEQALQSARDFDVDWVWLGVWEKNLHAIEFYKRQGFIEFGEHNFLIGGDLQRDLMLKKAVD